MAGQGFLAPQPLSRRLLTAACVAGGHLLALGLAFCMSRQGQIFRNAVPFSHAVVMQVALEEAPASPRRFAQAARTNRAIAAAQAPLSPIDQVSSAPAADVVAPVHLVLPATVIAIEPSKPVVSPSTAADPFAAYAHVLWQKVMAHRPAGIALEGTVLLGFHLDPAGRLTEAHIVQSSNIAMLDRQAMRALREASPFPPLPEEAGALGHDFTVPINFHP